MVCMVCGLLCLVVPARTGRCDDIVPAPVQWQVKADTIHYDQTNDVYTCQGHVRIHREGRTLTADRVRVDQKSRQALAEGQVRLLSGQDVLSGRRLELDLDTETGRLYDGALFFDDHHFYLSGREIHKTGEKTYFIEEASATSCDGERPNWELTSRNLKVTMEGYGIAKHATFRLKHVPILYSPYFIFPAKNGRQTGLLMPEAGTSDRKGDRYLQPFFWAIHRSMDATFFTDYMSLRGTRLGAEYRYVADLKSRGTLMADGFEDSKVDDRQGDNSLKWGYEDAPTDLDRPNRDRYWFRAKMDQALPGAVTAKLDLDVVSDQDYLLEFQNGFNGFERTREYYLGVFGRDIDDYNDTLRTNRLNLNRSWAGYSLNVDAAWNDNVILRRRDDQPDTTLQYLPQVTFDGTKKRIAGSALYFDLLSEYAYFHRSEGARGHRADGYPRIYWPTRPLNAFSFEPSVGLRQTVWHTEHDAFAGEGRRYDFSRTIYDARLNTSTDFFRVFNLNRAGFDRLKHTVKPQATYIYTPEQDQDDLPYFDALDRIDRENAIVYSLTNTLVARRKIAQTQGALASRYTYTPFLRFKLEQRFDINIYNQSAPEGNENERKYQPFSDVLLELDITPGRYLFLDGDARWSAYDGEFYAYNANARLGDNRGDSLSINYLFTREGDLQGGTVQNPTHSIIVSGALRISRQWLLRGDFERNIEDNRHIESTLGISYQSQCWGIDVDYTEQEAYNQSIQVMIHLLGLGAFGN
ncbi:MAG: LPS-assembly protein LptD [Desulfatitalea sp.]|nr:LPS assembly protein LptD [Desulfatitalea sp.]NNK01320.1 LPS-assembly protein LptD [Desulfatitalea sp.]